MRVGTRCFRVSHENKTSLCDAFYTLEWKKIDSNDVQVVGVYASLSLALKEEGILF